MDVSIFIAQILAIIYLVVGIGLFTNKKYYNEAILEMLNNPAIAYISGLFALTTGILIIKYHHLWQANWKILITIIGYIGLIKGIMLIITPKKMKLISDKLTQSVYEKFKLVIIFSLSIIFGYFGYIN